MYVVVVCHQELALRLLCALEQALTPPCTARPSVRPIQGAGAWLHNQTALACWALV